MKQEKVKEISSKLSDTKREREDTQWSQTSFEWDEKCNDFRVSFQEDKDNNH